MVLIDISSILHRMIFGSTRDASKITTINGKYKTEDFIKLTMHYILSELIDNNIKYKNYGEIVLCFDDYKKAYWRRDVYPNYKLSRRVSTQKSENPVNYPEVYNYTNELFEQIKNNTPWKCVYVNRAEADDIILVLAKEFHQEGILILSPDKDFLQAQRLPGIKQYSSLTHKWIITEDKHKDMQSWIYKHIMLGDVSDGIPKVVDFTEFSDSFKKHLKENNTSSNIIDFRKLPKEKQLEILNSFKERTYNRKGQDTGLDIYKQMRFGASDIEKILNGTWKQKQIINELKEEKKKIQEKIKHSSDKNEIKILRNKSKLITERIKITKPIEKDSNLDEFLDSHPLYREHYNRNFTLVMEEGIPDYIRKNILMEYNNAPTKYNEDEFCKYLTDNGLSTIVSKLPIIFKTETKLSITNCGWDF